MELPLLAASLRSRQDYDLIRSYIDVRQSSYSKVFQVVMAKIKEYYQRDANVSSVVPEVLLNQIAESIRNEKHVERFSNLIAEAIAADSSDVNVRAVVLIAKQQEVGARLAMAVNGNVGKENIDELVTEYQRLRAATELDEAEGDGLEMFHDIDLAAMMEREYDPSNLIKIYPRSLNDRLDGGAKRGHHFVVYGPVEVGKSATVITINCGFARQGLKSIYFINEDRPQDIILRHVSNLSGMNKYQIQADPKKAQRLANDNGFQNIMVVSAAPGTMRQLDDYVEKYDPAAIIGDQLRNFDVKAGNRVEQLEKAATGVRNIAKDRNVLAISVTQAGDSATGKLILETGDVDYSNVGIPAQADVMVGVGMDAQFEAEGLRMFSLPKNKISGKHDHWPVRISQQLSRMSSV